MPIAEGGIADLYRRVEELERGLKELTTIALLHQEALSGLVLALPETPKPEYFDTFLGPIRVAGN